MIPRLAVLASFALAAAAPRAVAQDVGLLLGVADRRTQYDSTPERLSTWWITYREGKALLAKTVAGLVVPRESGFWRVGISRFCTLPTAENGLTEHHCADSIWTGVAAQAAPRARATAPGDACPVDALSIQFASPAFLSISRNYWRSECRGSFLDGQESFVHTYESADSVSFATLGAGAGAAYRGAAAQALNVGAADSSQVQQDESCHTEPDEDTGWFIRRRQNRWSGVLFQQHGSDLCVFQQPIDWALPARAIGYAETAIDWNGVTRLLPDAEQAFLAPSGALALVVVPGAIRVYTVTSGLPGTTLLELPRPQHPATDVVMVQWALGRSVNRWTRMLAEVH